MAGIMNKTLTRMSPSPDVSVSGNNPHPFYRCHRGMVSGWWLRNAGENGMRPCSPKLRKGIVAQFDGGYIGGLTLPDSRRPLRCRLTRKE